MKRVKRIGTSVKMLAVLNTFSRLELLKINPNNGGETV
jgi:hypothetical protein